MSSMKITSSLTSGFNILSLSHTIWRDLIKPGSMCIDATCGNGHDAVALARLTLSDSPKNPGRLLCMDVQPSAIAATEARLKQEGFINNIEFYLGSHEVFPDTVPAGSVSCISYNLGYLPGADKGCKTLGPSTIASLSAAVHLIKQGGFLSIMAYRGHDGGMEESDAVEEFLCSLVGKQWRIMKHTPINRSDPPQLFTAFKHLP